MDVIGKIPVIMYIRNVAEDMSGTVTDILTLAFGAVGNSLFRVLPSNNLNVFSISSFLKK